MDRSELYDRMAERKSKPKDLEPYDGNNGRVNKAASFIRSGKLRKGGWLLDVGGGIGDLGYAVRDLFDTTVVVDISSKNLEAAGAKGNVIHLLDVDKQGLHHSIGKDQIDLVCALDFIEHIIDPESFARGCHGVLKQQGEVFINTPNIRFWPHINQLIYGGKFPHTSGDKEVFHGGHLAFFTFGDLCEIFGSAGFEGFEMFMDEEGYRDPSGAISDLQLNPKNQIEYKQLCLEFGCPNLLFKAVKR